MTFDERGMRWLLYHIVQSKGGREVSGMRRMRSSGSYSVDEAFERLAKEADKGES